MIEFQFKGNRNYVHGTDMINSYLKLFPNSVTLKVQILNVTSKNLRLSSKKEGNIIAVFQSTGANGELSKDYFVESVQDVQSKYDFDEGSLTSNSIISNFTIFMNLNSSFSLIENIVALNKKLLNQTISSEVKWWFVGIELEVIPKKAQEGICRLVIEKRLGTKLVISNILLNDTKIGNIKFSSK